MTNKLLSIVVADGYGVLTKVTGIFSRCEVNVLSLTFASNQPLMRITVLLQGEERKYALALGLLNKLEDVKITQWLDEADQNSCQALLAKVEAVNDKNTLETFAHQYGLTLLNTADNVVVVRGCFNFNRTDEVTAGLSKFKLMQLSLSGPFAL